MSNKIFKLNVLRNALLFIFLVASINILIVLFKNYAFSFERSYGNQPTTKAYSPMHNEYAFIERQYISNEYSGAIIACGLIAMSCIISVVWIEVTKAKLDTGNVQKEWI